MAVVLLARHGQAAFSGEYGDLTGLGRDQALRLGELLADRGAPPRRVVSGTLQRQTTTASICCDVLLEGEPPGAAPADGGIAREVDSRWDEYDWPSVLQAYA